VGDSRPLLIRRSWRASETASGQFDPAAGATLSDVGRGRHKDGFGRPTP